MNKTIAAVLYDNIQYILTIWEKLLAVLNTYMCTVQSKVHNILVTDDK
jgi:hypothetical protein